MDASMSPAVARELRALGFDVVDHRDLLAPASSDTVVLDAAWSERRLVVARDYDMGELVLRGFARAEGILIVAFDFTSAADEAKRIAADLTTLGERARGAVSVLEPAGVRSRPYDLGSE